MASSFMYLLYSFLLAWVAVLTLPWWLLQMLRLGKYRAGLAERLGFVPTRLKIASGRSIWVHAVSVGEVIAVSRLITELRLHDPNCQVFVSTTTAAGQRVARERFGEAHCFFVPLDFGFCVRRYLNALRPSLLVLAETEFWPNLLHLAKKHGAAVAVVNARISDRSFPRYRRFCWFFARVLAPVDLFLAQTAEDGERLRAIGALTARIQVSGNLKFDIHPGPASPLLRSLRATVSMVSPVIVAGSTAAGEEELMLAAFRQVRVRFPQALLVLAPRHPERFDSVAAAIVSSGETLVRRSSWSPASGQLAAGVFLLDSVGELASVYGLADIAFVGGSLVPTGGHNILEPAQHGVPILVGPHTFNFREIVSIFEKGDAVRVVTAESLGRIQLALLENAEERRLLGHHAKELFAQYAGATQRTLQALRPLLSDRGANG